MSVSIPNYTTVFKMSDSKELHCHVTGRTTIIDVKYDNDGMRLNNKNIDFLKDQKFHDAYNAASAASGPVYEKIRIEYRVYMLIWAARQAMNLEGDFVECGVNTGLSSMAVCNYIQFENVPKKLYLFDTFAGIPESQVAQDENITGYRNLYFECYDLVKNNFSKYPNVVLVRGAIPESLHTVDIPKVSYLHIDMNIEYPEREALEYFWPRLVSGGIVMLDDYGFEGHEKQKRSHDEFARRHGLMICALPTGQGMLIKP